MKKTKFDLNRPVSYDGMDMLILQKMEEFRLSLLKEKVFQYFNEQKNYLIYYDKKKNIFFSI